MPINHLDIVRDPDRATLREIMHDRQIHEVAHLHVYAYEALVEQMVKCRDNTVMDASSGGHVRITSTGMMRMHNTRSREMGMPQHDAADLLFLLMDKPHQRDLPKPGSLRHQNYVTIVKNTLNACRKYGLDIPMDNPMVMIALGRAGLTPELEPVTVDNPSYAPVPQKSEGEIPKPPLLPAPVETELAIARRNIQIAGITKEARELEMAR